jgi:tyrosine-protein phosphatase non-receptor type 9
MARKFNVDRALLLFHQHEITRIREGLVVFNPLEEPLKSELESGKFTVLSGKDHSGATIALFTASRHYPHLTSHRATLQGVVYQLDHALADPSTQRAGLVFVYDMTDSKYSNFDYELSQRILTLLKSGYPARLKKVLIVTAPLWFKAPFKILRLFVREKLRDRVHTISVPQVTFFFSLFRGASSTELICFVHCRQLLHTLPFFPSYLCTSQEEACRKASVGKAGLSTSSG